MLKDLDLASPDVIAMLYSLVESEIFPSSTNSSTRAFINPECHMIATLSDTLRNHDSRFLISKYPIVVQLPSFTTGEIEGIILDSYPNLGRFYTKIIEIFTNIQTSMGNLPMHERRLNTR